MAHLEFQRKSSPWAAGPGPSEHPPSHRRGRQWLRPSQRGPPGLRTALAVTTDAGGVGPLRMLHRSSHIRGELFKGHAPEILSKILCVAHCAAEPECALPPEI